MADQPPTTGTDQTRSPDEGTPEQTFFSDQALAGIPWVVAGKLILFFVYFAMSVLTVRYLGKDEYGVLSLCRNLAESLAAVCALGLTTALLRFVPELVVNRNRAGLNRLLGKSFLLQGAMVLVVAAGVLGARSWLDLCFGVSFGLALPFSVLVLAAYLVKGNVSNSLTALFRVRELTLISMFQSVLWLGILVVVLRVVPTAAAALLIEGVVLLAASTVAGWVLWRHVRSLDWRSPLYGIGKRRTLRISAASLLNTLGRMLMFKYTEVFFLGIYTCPAVVGFYDLGYMLPQLVLTLVPSAVQTLLTSAFAEAYTRDPNCLARLIEAVYKMLILMAAPLAAFGVFFSSQGVILIYGQEMAEAGPVASAFCLLHLLPLISVPLSMAIMARERVLNMLPLMVLQVGVNLGLDIALIPRFGMSGAVWAVFATFLLTIPVRLYVVRKLVGGIFFPFAFFLRISVPVFVLAAAISGLAPHLTLATYIVAAAFYLLVVAAVLRYGGLVRPEDVTEFRTIGSPRLNRLLDLATGEGR